jgi:YD repeat-containing protein
MDYRYDDLNRIDTFKVNSTTEQTWVYDSNGNMTSFDGTTFTYSTGTNKISSDGSQTFTHDAAGRLTGNV